jgi:hypothetical protein
MGEFSFTSVFGFTINWDFWSWLVSLPTASVINYIFAIIGWTFLALVFYYIGAHFWAAYRGEKYTAKWQFILLAVDIPPMYIQTPKAVEQIFAHLSGAKISPGVKEKFWTGKRQKFFSFEIISIEGYIQFLIRTEMEFRDLVEAAVYAQYPEAEITEVEDYVEMVPNGFPNPTHHMLAVDFKLADADAFPIRTYPSFEYKISKDDVFSDPMAAILENFSRIGHGENFWFQIILEPTGNAWKEKGIALVKDIIAGHHGHHAHGNPLLMAVGDFPMKVAKEFLTYINGTEFGGHEEEHTEGKLSDLTPGMKSTIEAIEDKIAKLGFKVKMRAVYMARNEVFNPSRCIDGFVGALNQFHVQSRNAVVPSSNSHGHFAFFKKWQQLQLDNKFIKAYVKRKLKVGSSPCILNIEELATIWHFPLPFVKTPLIQKAGAKRGEAPMNLPIDTIESPLRVKAKIPEAHIPIPVVEAEPPEDLPYG